MMKNQKGITLIALVITIIVLLILAGVSIAMLMGDNGILTNASEAQVNTARENAIEKIGVALQSIKTEVLANEAANSQYSAESDLENLKKESVTGITTEDTASGGYTVTTEGTSIKITFEKTPLNLKVEGKIDVSGANGGTITAAKVVEE